MYKEDLALNNLQWLICRKTQQINKQTCMFIIYLNHSNLAKFPFLINDKFIDFCSSNKIPFCFVLTDHFLTQSINNLCNYIIIVLPYEKKNNKLLLVPVELFGCKTEFSLSFVYISLSELI